jgi:nucleoside-diphosphate-sugar epimerase
MSKSDSKIMNVLVTGGAGNVGSSLVDRLVREPDIRVVVLDNLLTGSLDKLPPASTKDFQFIRGDVNDSKLVGDVMRSEHFDYVFHYAAVVGVQRTLDNPVMVLNDIAGIRNILDTSRDSGVKRVFYSSSSEVYGEPVEFPQNENTTPLNSKLPYAVVKNVGEAFLRSYYKEYGLNYTILRFFNTYGPRQSDDFVISRFITQAIEGKDITVYGAGNQSRTFCYIDDNIETTIRCLRENLIVNDTMNVGSDDEISIADLANLVIRITGSRSKVIFLPALKEGDMSRRKPDNTKMRAILNRPLLSLEEGIRRTIQHRKS